ncbi:MAG: MFS transporter [Elusimicrobiaceae bacterium]|nr:MFS transporter [Elusimicrobiaceae bacterium]
MQKLKLMFRAFKYRNFRLFFPGLAISQIGIWIQNVTIAWLVYDITKSPFAMGTIMCITSAPMLFIMPFAGVLADKFNRQKLLFIVQILFASQALLITLFTVTGNIKIWSIILCGLFLNSIAAIDNPLRQSTFVLLVDDIKDLPNAISLNSACFNVARFIGPAIGGFLIAYTNISFCFFLNFLLILPNIYLVSQMKINDEKTEEIKNETMLHSLKTGLSYILKHHQLSVLQFYFAVFCLLMLAYPMLMPVYVTKVLNGKPDTLGLILGAVGVGSLLASLLLATKTTVNWMRRILFAGCTIICLAYILVGNFSNVTLTIILMFFAGLGMSSFTSTEIMLLQSVIADSKRGRVMSINGLCFAGTNAISSFFAGSLAGAVGVAHTFIILGSVMLIIACVISYKLSKYDYHKKVR